MSDFSSTYINLVTGLTGDEAKAAAATARTLWQHIHVPSEIVIFGLGGLAGTQISVVSALAKPAMRNAPIKTAPFATLPIADGKHHQ